MQKCSAEATNQQWKFEWLWFPHYIEFKKCISHEVRAAIQQLVQGVSNSRPVLHCNSDWIGVGLRGTKTNYGNIKRLLQLLRKNLNLNCCSPTKMWKACGLLTTGCVLCLWKPKVIKSIFIVLFFLCFIRFLEKDVQ